MTVSTPNEVPSPMRGSDFRGVEARDWGCACDACRATLYVHVCVHTVLWIDWR